MFNFNLNCHYSQSGRQWEGVRHNEKDIETVREILKDIVWKIESKNGNLSDQIKRLACHLIKEKTMFANGKKNLKELQRNKNKIQQK
jgi:hypothetical protein